MSYAVPLVEKHDAAAWPHDVDVEEAVIGVMLGRPELIDHLGPVKEDDFFCAWHRVIWELIEETRLAGRAVSALSVISDLREIRSRSDLDYIPDEGYDGDINEIAICAPFTAGGAKSAGDTLRHLAHRRRMIAALGAGIGDAQAIHPDDTPSKMAARVIEAIHDVTPAETRREPRGAVLDRILARAERAEADTGLRVLSGLKVWDEKVAAMKPGEVHIIGARPGMGKTIVGASFGLNAAERGQGALFFSMEMSEEQLSSRVLCDMVHRNGHELWTNTLRKGSIPGFLIDPLLDARDRLDQIPLYIDDRRGLTLADMGLSAREAQRQMEKKGVRLSLIVVDYLTLIQPSDRYKGNKVAEVTEISRGLKMLAGDLAVPIVALCQLNRNTEARTNADNRPRLSDLRESGAIEQDAETISLLFREEYYVRNREPATKATEEYGKWLSDLESCRDLLEINLAKNRDGQTGVLQAKIIAACSALRDL